MNGVLLVVALVLIVAVPAHIYVAWKYTRAATSASSTPASLNLMVLIVVCTTFGALMFAVLGAHTIVFQQTGDRLLPPPFTTLAIAAGALVISLPLPFELRQLRRWASEAIEEREHRRVGDTRPRTHRRGDDPEVGV